MTLTEAEPEKPPFQIAHLGIAEVLQTVKALHPFCAGKPATLDVMRDAMRGAQGLPDGVTDSIALDCMLWAIDIRKQHQRERANHMKSGATIGYASHLVKQRFKMAGRMIFGKRKPAKRAGRGARRKKSESR